MKAFSEQIPISVIAQFRYTIAIVKKRAIAVSHTILKSDRYLFPKIRNIPFFSPNKNRTIYFLFLKACLHQLWRKYNYKTRLLLVC